MIQTLTAKIRIMPSEEDGQLLLTTMKAYAEACSFVAQKIAENHVPLRICAIHKEVYRSCRILFGLPSQMAASTIRTAVASYKTIRTLKERHPSRFSSKKRNRVIVPEFRKPQVSLVWNRDYSIVWDKNHTKQLFSINTLKGRIRVSFRADAFAWAFSKDASFGTAKLVCRHGKFFLHVPVSREIPDPAPLTPETTVVGIDRGIRFLTATYDGRKSSFVSGSVIRHKRAHYKTLRQELQRRKTSSARKRLRAIGQRENRWIGDVNHCLSKALVCGYPKGTVFALEDLTGIRSATERVRVKDRYVSVSWAYYDFESKLTYKAALAGSRAVKFNPAYTSQACPVCGHTEKANRIKKQHLFCCRKCGYRSNDDRIGAMNLWRMGIQYLLGARVSA